MNFNIKHFLSILLFAVFHQALYGSCHNDEADTTFLYRKTYRSKDSGKIYVSRFSVYVDPNTSSKYYGMIGDFNFDLDDYNNMERLSDTKKVFPPDLPLEWLPLYMYNNKYYLYAPCEWLIPRYKITDTTLLWYGWMDGVYGFDYKKIERKSKNHFCLYDVHGAYFSELNIHVIDENKGIAVFEANDSKNKYSLKVRADKAHLFPIIVYDCDDKVEEYEFQEPDFQKLLKRVKK